MVPGTASDAVIQIGATREGNIAGGTAGKIGAILVTAGDATSVKLERPAAFGLTVVVSAAITASSLQYRRYIRQLALAWVSAGSIQRGCARIEDLKPSNLMLLDWTNLELVRW